MNVYYQTLKAVTGEQLDLYIYPVAFIHPDVSTSDGCTCKQKGEWTFKHALPHTQNTQCLIVPTCSLDQTEVNRTETFQSNTVHGPWWWPSFTPKLWWKELSILYATYILSKIMYMYISRKRYGKRHIYIYIL